MSTDIRTITFESPTPIDFSFALQAARLELVASDRVDTVVTIAPRSPNRAGDLALVQQIGVEHSADRLEIIAPKRWSILGPGNDSVVITIELPTDSRVGGEIAFGNVRGTGRLGDIQIKSSYGELSFDEVGAAELKTSSGDIAIGVATGDFELTTSNGGIRADILDGSGSVKTSNGEISVGEVTGALQARASYGGIRIDYAGTETFAKIAYGNLHIGEVVEGSVKLEGNGGDIKVGVPEGTAAWLDVNSAKGFVRNELNAGSAPQPGDKTVEIRARVTWGDIVIHRPVNRRPGERRTSKKGNK